MPIEHTFTILRPELGDTEERLLAKILSASPGTSDEGTLLASASRSVSTSSPVIDLSRYSGVVLHWIISSASGTGGLILFPEHQCPITGTWNRFWNYPASPRTTVGNLMVQIGRGIGTQSGGGLTGLGLFATLCGRMRFTVNHADASSYTYSLGRELIP